MSKLVCPRCRREYDVPPVVSECTACGSPLAASLAGDEPGSGDDARWSEPVVVLTAGKVFDLLPAKSLLEENGIPAFAENEQLSSGVAGLMDFALDRRGPVLSVARRHLKRANEILCENGIRCEVPADALERVVTRVFEPAISGQGAYEPDRVLSLLEHQTKDFRRAAFVRAAHLPGGAEWLVRLAESAALDGLGTEEVRNDLAATLADHHGGPAAAKLAHAGEHAPDGAARRRFAVVLAHFRYPAAARTLVRLLEDRDPGVRDEALEALYFLSEGETFGFEPSASDVERAAPLAKWREWADALGPHAATDASRGERA